MYQVARRAMPYRPMEYMSCQPAMFEGGIENERVAQDMRRPQSRRATRARL
jgi:hypothetical protein